MPLGKFIPFDPADYSPRFFARPLSFDCECPYCGRLLLLGRFRRDSQSYDRVTSIVTCHVKGNEPSGCGRKFLIGMVAWTLRPGHTAQRRPPDHMPNERELAELRAYTQGIWPKQPKQRGQSLNTIQELPDDEGE